MPRDHNHHKPVGKGEITKLYIWGQLVEVNAIHAVRRALGSSQSSRSAKPICSCVGSKNVAMVTAIWRTNP